MIGCDRVKPWTAVTFQQTAEGVPHQVEGNQQGLMLAQGVPGFHQWSLEIPEGQVARLSWTMQGGGLFGGAPSPLGLAVRAGEMVAVNGFTGEFTGSTLADASVPDTAMKQIAEVGGACIPAGGGTTYVTFRNTGTSGSPVAVMTIEMLDASTGDVPYADCM